MNEENSWKMITPKKPLSPVPSQCPGFHGPTETSSSFLFLRDRSFCQKGKNGGRRQRISFGFKGQQRRKNYVAIEREGRKSPRAKKQARNIHKTPYFFQAKAKRLLTCKTFPGEELPFIRRNCKVPLMPFPTPISRSPLLPILLLRGGDGANGWNHPTHTALYQMKQPTHLSPLNNWTSRFGIPESESYHLRRYFHTFLSIGTRNRKKDNGNCCFVRTHLCPPRSVVALRSPCREPSPRAGAAGRSSSSCGCRLGSRSLRGRGSSPSSSSSCLGSSPFFGGWRTRWPPSC